VKSRRNKTIQAVERRITFIHSLVHSFIRSFIYRSIDQVKNANTTKSMGIFKKKSSAEHPILSRGSKGMLTKVKSSDTQEEEEGEHKVVVAKKKTGRIFGRYKLPTFRRLEEDYYGGVNDAVLPEEDEYEPPTDVFHVREKRKPAPAKEPRIELKGSDQTFDIRDDDTITNFEGEHSNSTFGGEHNDFSQFVFDEAFNTLGTVVVTKSDHGSNDTAENNKNVSKMLAAAGDLHKAYLDENSGDTRNVRNGRNLTVIKKEFRSAQKPKTVKPKSLVPPQSDSKFHYTNSSESRSHGLSKNVNMNIDQENNFGTAESKALFSPLSESSINNQRSRDEERDRFYAKASQTLLSPQKNARPSTVAMKAAKNDDQSHDQFGSLASRSFARPQKSRGHPSITETRTEKSSVYDEQSQNQYPSLAAHSFAHSQKSAVRPPKTIMTSDQSFASNNSRANATVMALEEFTQDHPFFNKSGGNDTYGGAFIDKDPFGEATYWGGDMDPFSQSRDSEKESSVGKSSDAESLIDSIKRSASRGRQDADENSHKPDPSPRGVQKCNSDSHVSYWEKGAVAYTSFAGRAPPPPPPPPPPRKVDPEPTNPDIEPTSPEQSPREVNSDTQISYWENGSVAYSVGPQKALPNGGQKNAILGSMLFRKTYPGKAPSETPAIKETEDHDDQDEQLPDVPPSILTDESAHSSVSSVTEEASSFYQKNFQSGWKTQAHNVLNNYHNARKVRPHNDSSNRSVESHYLERVEEEHTNMFSA
jgi:hypothetical protein